MTHEGPGVAFGARVRDLRQGHGMTRTELAALVGLQANDIVAVECDGRYATLLLIHRLAAALDVAARDLV